MINVFFNVLISREILFRTLICHRLFRKIAKPHGRPLERVKTSELGWLKGGRGRLIGVLFKVLYRQQFRDFDISPLNRGSLCNTVTNDKKDRAEIDSTSIDLYFNPRRTNLFQKVILKNVLIIFSNLFKQFSFH